MTISLQPKRPGEVREYPHDWSPFLGSETISGTPTTTAAGALTTPDVSSVVQSGNKAVILTVSGGDLGVGTITQTIQTSDGRTETETFVLQISEVEEPVSLADAKAYLRVTSVDEDAKIESMIPRARLWVEDHTGLVLTRREFVERHIPQYGAIRLDKGPLVAPTAADVEITYTASGVPTIYEGRVFPPSTTIFPAADDSWPSLSSGEQFTITYTAGFDVGEADDRLIGAMLALIEGEYAEGYAYPPRAMEAAERCCVYLRQMVA